MTTPEVRQANRSTAIRAIASSLCFDQDPPVVRSLANARRAAEGVLDALVAAGIVDPARYANGAASNGGRPVDDSEPLFPAQPDPEA